MDIISIIFVLLWFLIFFAHQTFLVGFLFKTQFRLEMYFSVYKMERDSVENLFKTMKR